MVLERPEGTLPISDRRGKNMIVTMIIYAVAMIALGATAEAFSKSLYRTHEWKAERCRVTFGRMK